ncbi:hypothetical protein DL768_004553 [Monosporascus sp. mg162]|nr:hypothetical protein DL768_004553 [Monosporascus sp. mg162]
MSKKRTIDDFFGSPKPKKPRGGVDADNSTPTGHSTHAAYPFPIPHLPASIGAELLESLPARPGHAIDDRPDLDLLYFEPYVPRSTAQRLFRFLRASLPFYRVEYDIRRGGISTHIRTPRWTTVFGVDDTSRFAEEDGAVVDARTGARVPTTGDGGRHYAKYPPRPIPKCLDDLRRSIEAVTGYKFNFCLVNYYASGSDSISFHSDDERFLGPLPAIASFSLGVRRDFLMKHKPVPNLADGAADGDDQREAKPLKLPLASGDMILMRGRTQADWLHSIPKRSGKDEQDGGRINITFRRVMVKAGSENYYNYNVNTGQVYRWDSVNSEMKQWNP